MKEQCDHYDHVAFLGGPWDGQVRRVHDPYEGMEYRVIINEPPSFVSVNVGAIPISTVAIGRYEMKKTGHHFIGMWRGIIN